MKKIITSIFILSLIIISFPVSAQLANTEELENITNTVATNGNLSQGSIGNIAATIIETILGLLAIIFLILIIYSGIQWMTSSGNEEAITKAKKTIISATIGLIIILSAYAITYFIFNGLPFSGGDAIPTPS